MEASKNRKMDETLDGLLVDIGEMGRYQIMQYTLICTIVFVTSINMFSYLFTAGDVVYRCQVPECEPYAGRIANFSPEWLKFAVPYENDGTPSRCSRYQNVYEAGPETTGSLSDTYQGPGVACESRYFDSSKLVACEHFVYDSNDDFTIVTAFNLTCKENDWWLAFIGTLGSIPTLVALPFCAVMSDIYGRKPIVVWAILLNSVAGIIKAFSINYTMFATMEFLSALLGCGIYSTIFVMAIELAGPSKRVISATLVGLMYSLSQTFLGVEAFFIRDYRLLTLALFVPNLLLLATVKYLPESFRWLMINQKHSQLQKLLLKVARVNGVTLNPNRFHDIMSEESSDLLAQTEEVPSSEQLSESRQAFRSRILIVRLLIFFVCWFTSCFVYNGMSIQSITLGGNKFMNFILTNLVEIPSILVASCLIERLGRKRSVYGFLFITAIGCALSEILTNGILRLFWYLVAKCSVTISYTALYMFTGELFPTSMRQTFMSACAMIGAMGAMVSPLATLLVQYWAPFPIALFCVSAVVTGTMVLVLPETKNSKFPDTVKEAESIGKI